MESSPKYRSRSEQEREAVKKTFGYKIWMVMFVLLYPFVAVFTFVFSVVVKFFSLISQALSFVFVKLFAGSRS